MSHTVAEQALARVFFYLESHGVELTQEVCLNALRLVTDVLATDPEHPMTQVMDELQRRFELPPVPLPRAFPPINRGSIGYD